MPILQVVTLVSTGGTMKIEQAGPHSYKVMRSGNVDSYIAHLSDQELRDLYEVAGDLIEFLDCAAEHTLDVAN
jgi:hypothetical protein